MVFQKLLETAWRRMGVNKCGLEIDERGHNNPPRCVDFASIARNSEILDLATGTDGVNDSIAQKDITVRDNAQISESGTTSGSTWTTQSKQLACPMNQGIFSHETARKSGQSDGKNGAKLRLPTTVFD